MARDPWMQSIRQYLSKNLFYDETVPLRLVVDSCPVRQVPQIHEAVDDQTVASKEFVCVASDGHARLDDAVMSTSSEDNA